MKAAEEAVARLAALPLFEGAAPEVVRSLAAGLRERRLAGGELLCGRGDPGDALFVVAEGRLRVSVVTSEGRELSMRIVGAGEMVGEISVFDGGLRTTDMTAIVATRVLALPAAALFSAMEAYPAIARSALKIVCGRLRDTTSQLEAIALFTIEQRLARLLLLALRGVETPTGRRAAVALDLSQTEIAQLLGASRPKVNVALGRLEQAGALRRTADRLFCERALLERFAETGHA